MSTTTLLQDMSTIQKQLDIGSVEAVTKRDYDAKEYELADWYITALGIPKPVSKSFETNIYQATIDTFHELISQKASPNQQALWNTMPLSRLAQLMNNPRTRPENANTMRAIYERRKKKEGSGFRNKRKLKNEEKEHGKKKERAQSRAEHRERLSGRKQKVKENKQTLKEDIENRGKTKRQDRSALKDSQKEVEKEKKKREGERKLKPDTQRIKEGQKRAARRKKISSSLSNPERGQSKKEHQKKEMRERIKQAKESMKEIEKEIKAQEKDLGISFTNEQKSKLRNNLGLQDAIREMESAKQELNNFDKSEDEIRAETEERQASADQQRERQQSQQAFQEAKREVHTKLGARSEQAVHLNEVLNSEQNMLRTQLKEAQRSSNYARAAQILNSLEENKNKQNDLIRFEKDIAENTNKLKDIQNRIRSESDINKLGELIDEANGLTEAITDAHAEIKDLVDGGGSTASRTRSTPTRNTYSPSATRMTYGGVVRDAADASRSLSARNSTRNVREESGIGRPVRTVNMSPQDVLSTLQNGSSVIMTETQYDSIYENYPGALQSYGHKIKIEAKSLTILGEMKQMMIGSESLSLDDKFSFVSKQIDKSSVKLKSF